VNAKLDGELREFMDARDHVGILRARRF